MEETLYYHLKAIEYFSKNENRSMMDDNRSITFDNRSITSRHTQKQLQRDYFSLEPFSFTY